jgi:peptide/nickel transport system substrate-binding protein
MTIKANHAFNTMLAPVERVDTPSPDIAIIRLSRPYPAPLYALSPALCPIMPKHMYDDGQPFRTHPRHVRPVGSGPYRLVEFEPGQRIVLERHAGFFLKDRPKFDRVVFRVIQDSAAQALAIERGEVDVLSGPLSVSQVSQLSKVPAVRIVRQGGEAIGSVGGLEFNLRRKPFDDDRVRRAIWTAIDREFIVRQLHQGTTRVATGPLVPGNPFYTDRVDSPRHDLARANALLDEAGLRRDASGTRFAMTLGDQPGFPDNHQTRSRSWAARADLVELPVGIWALAAPFDTISRRR